MHEGLQRAVDRLPEGPLWSACVRDAATGEVLASRDPGRSLPIASVGKVLLLLELARRITSGELDPHEPIDRTHVAHVTDSGLWQHMDAVRLSIHDCAVLVASVSDNLATNVLLDRIGLPALDDLATTIDTDMRMHDIVRDRRGPSHPHTLASGSTGSMSGLCARIARGEALSAGISAMTRSWLSLGVDSSMVAGGVPVDPLAHASGTDTLAVWHKTGRDRGTRADIGTVALTADHSADHSDNVTGHRTAVRIPPTVISYAIACRGDESQMEPAMTGMHEVGRAIVEALAAST